MPHYQDLVSLSYKPLTTRRRQYAEWHLVAHGRGMCPLTPHHIDVGNVAFTGLMESINNHAVTHGEVVVMVYMEAIMMLEYTRASVALKELWDISDPIVIQLHPAGAFEICLRALVKDFAENLLLPNLTKTEFRMVMRGRIRKYKGMGYF
jgi:hypothetical protein